MSLSKLLHVMSKGVQNRYLIPIVVGGSSEERMRWVSDSLRCNQITLE